MLCFHKTREGAELLLDFCAGSLEPARAAELERHVAGCADCRDLLEAQRAVWKMLDRWTPPMVSGDFNAQLFARIAEEEASSGWRKWLPGVFRPVVPYSIWKPAALAAAGAVLVVGFLARPPGHHESPQIDADKVDIEQVANTLEELDMLTPVTPAPASSM